jgi:hypothetical protein
MLGKASGVIRMKYKIMRDVTPLYPEYIMQVVAGASGYAIRCFLNRQNARVSIIPIPEKDAKRVLAEQDKGKAFDLAWALMAKWEA